MIHTQAQDATLLAMVSTPVDRNEDLEPLVTQLLAEVDQTGVGLAAVQIGIPKQVIVLQVDGPKKGYTVAFNPHWVQTRPMVVSSLEGCLSLPDQQYMVPRYQSIILSYYDRHWKPRTRRLLGYPAFIAQHECQHARGILISRSGVLLAPQLSQTG